jgi:DNA-binding response OmpR family regulator
MPNKDGFALVADLLEKNERPVIVIYTGAVDQDMARDFLARGADHIAFKPTDLALLAARVKSLVGRRREEHSPRCTADCTT